jgi:protein SCO1/2
VLAGIWAPLLLAACGGSRELVGYQISPAADVDVEALPDASRDGEPFRFVGRDGGVLLVYFGYTSCPDACPATMAEVSRAIDELDDDAARVDVAVVSVDPARDADVLTDYAQSFVAGAHAIVTTDEMALRRVAQAFGADYAVDERPGGAVKVDHTTYLYGVDDTGHLAITWPLGTPGDDIAHDVGQLLDEQER